MKVVIDYPASRLPGTFEAFSIVMLGAAAVMIPLSYASQVDVPTSSLRFLGGACPLCGGTRAVTALCLGRFETAITYNPLALIIFGLMLYAAFSYIFVVLPFGRRPVLFTSPRESFALKSLIIAAFVANWAYVLWAGMYRVPLAV
ncbi:hypothetical protein PLCT1_02697 [Planctomycetaceae bacterium]|nr:hypothetical protein PLCT1_02697 [Planctomycetaceae bacterium]